MAVRLTAGRSLLVLYLLLLVVSHGLRACSPAGVTPPEGARVADLRAVDGEETAEGLVRLVWRDAGPREPKAGAAGAAD